nr:DinB family protein [uncultured Flavobacterium sp.]
MKEQIDTWHINNRINLYLLDAITESSLNDISASKGRKVKDQFAHLHNVRMMWLKAAAPGLLEGLIKIDKEITINKTLLVTELNKSAEAIAQLLEKGFTENKIKGFKPHPAAFLGYLISHESHHRGQIVLTLKQAGHPIDQKTQFGLWEWGSR